MSKPLGPDRHAFGLPQDPGPYPALPRELDTADRWEARARLVRPGAEPAGQVAIERRWVPVYHRRDTVPIESGADLDATSAAPRASRVPGVYDYPSGGRGPAGGTGS